MKKSFFDSKQQLLPVETNPALHENNESLPQFHSILHIPEVWVCIEAAQKHVSGRLFVTTLPVLAPYVKKTQVFGEKDVQTWLRHTNSMSLGMGRLPFYIMICTSQDIRQ